MTYTLSTEQVRKVYAVDGIGAPSKVNELAFNRWYAEELRQAKEQAWDEGFDAGEQDVLEHITFDEPCKPNPYRSQE